MQTIQPYLELLKKKFIESGGIRSKRNILMLLLGNLSIFEHGLMNM